MMSGIFLAGVGDRMSTVVPETVATRQAAEAAVNARSDVRDLRDQVDRTSMLLQAMWELIAERLSLTDQDLERKALEVDLRDGVEDGKLRAHPLRCPNCGRVSNSRHKKCLYCGLLFEGSIFS